MRGIRFIHTADLHSFLKIIKAEQSQPLKREQPCADTGGVLRIGQLMHRRIELFNKKEKVSLRPERALPENSEFFLQHQDDQNINKQRNPGTNILLPSINL